MLPLVYVAGYGRSGSTVLERILDLHPAVIASGELCNLFAALACGDSRCACGAPLDSCVFWGRVIDAMNRSVRQFVVPERWVPALEAVEKYPYFLSGGQSAQAAYGVLMRGLFQAIAATCDPQVRYLVDSSKTSYRRGRRPLYLARYAEQDVYIIHLVRDIRGVVCSKMAGPNVDRMLDSSRGNRFSFVRAIVGWLNANRAAEYLARTRPDDRYIRMRYEDLVGRPAEELARIGRMLCLDLDSLSRMIVDGQRVQIAGNHQLSGNRMRLSGELVLSRDDRWVRTLSPKLQRTAVLLTYPLMRRYGYV